MKMNVKELAKEQESYVIQCRHYLHSHPELSTKEVNTTRFIKEELEKMGVEVQEFEGITGCVGTIKGDKQILMPFLLQRTREKATAV